MTITKERKDELVAGYVDLLKQTSGFIIIQYAQMPTPEINALRAKIRDAKGKYVVAKNTLLTKALQQMGWPVPDDMLKGPSAIAFGMEDMPGVAKVVLEYLGDKDAEKIKTKGGIFGNQIFKVESLDAISKLPTLDELRSQIAGLIIAPANGLVNVLHAATGQIVNVLQAWEDKHKEGAADGAA